jgi:hypothetical protein
MQGVSYCCEAGQLVTFRDKFLDPCPKRVSGQEHPSLAFRIFEADVGASLATSHA